MKEVILNTLKHLGLFISALIVMAGCMLAIVAPFMNTKWFIFSGVWMLLMYGGMFFYYNYNTYKNKES